MTDQKNTILAIVLSALVLIGWQYFFDMPQMEKQRQDAAAQTQAAAAAAGAAAAPARPATPPAGASAGAAAAAARPAGAPRRPARSAATRSLAASPRVTIETPQPARLDLAQGRAHRRSVAGQVSARPSIRNRRAIVLLSPSGTPASVLRRVRLGRRRRRDRQGCPTSDTVWTAGGLRQRWRRPARSR